MIETKEIKIKYFDLEEEIYFKENIFYCLKSIKDLENSNQFKFFLKSLEFNQKLITKIYYGKDEASLETAKIFLRDWYKFQKVSEFLKSCNLLITKAMKIKFNTIVNSIDLFATLI